MLNMLETFHVAASTRLQFDCDQLMVEWQSKSQACSKMTMYQPTICFEFDRDRLKRA